MYVLSELATALTSTLNMYKHEKTSPCVSEHVYVCICTFCHRSLFPNFINFLSAFDNRAKIINIRIMTFVWTEFVAKMAILGTHLYSQLCFSLSHWWIVKWLGNHYIHIIYHCRSLQRKTSSPATSRERIWDMTTSTSPWLRRYSTRSAKPTPFTTRRLATVRESPSLLLHSCSRLTNYCSRLTNCCSRLTNCCSRLTNCSPTYTSSYLKAISGQIFAFFCCYQFYAY